jgi:uncharacterized UPF0160 family protein
MSTLEPSSKRVKMSDGSSVPVIGTHNGHFHADEALAVYLLRQLPAYKNAQLVRTRDAERLQTCDIVVDVGAVHDHGIRRYDHHQREFTATFPGHGTKLSSAGLVWMHYGPEIIESHTNLAPSSAENALLYEKTYTDFIEAFDGNDNGIAPYDPAALRAAGIEKRFSDKSFSLASVVNKFNFAPSDPNAASTSEKASSSDEEDARFLRASAFVGQQFAFELAHTFNSWLPARGVVAEAFRTRHEVHPSGKVILIPHRPEGVPWAEHLYNLEESEAKSGEILYAVFPESGEKDSKWRIRAVSLENGSFENRKSLPEAWRGLRDDELSQVSGVPGSVFIHAGGFIGGNQTYEGVVALAGKAVEL